MDNIEAKKLEVLKEQINAIPIGRKAGRPRKWKADYIDKQAELLNEWLDKRTVDQLFWIKEYCLESGHSYSQIQQFADISFNYKKAVERLKTMQEVALCKWGAVKGNSFIYAIFMLKAVCGLRDGNNKDSDKANKPGSYTDEVRDNK